MADKEGLAAKETTEIRMLRSKEYQALQAQQERVQQMYDGKEDVIFSLTFLKDKTADILAINKKLIRYFKHLEQKEEQEDEQQHDTELKEEIAHVVVETVKLCYKLQTWKSVSLLIESIAEALETVETLKADDPSTDISDCIPNIQEQVNEMTTLMKDYTGDLTDQGRI